MKKFAHLKNCIYLIYSRGWQKGPFPGTLRVKHKISIERTSRIFYTNYSQSKWPHLYRAYVVGGCIFFAMAVCCKIMSAECKCQILKEAGHKVCTSYSFHSQTSLISYRALQRGFLTLGGVQKLREQDFGIFCSLL